MLLEIQDLDSIVIFSESEDIGCQSNWKSCLDVILRRSYRLVSHRVFPACVHD